MENIVTKTIGELRAAINGYPDETPVLVQTVSADVVVGEQFATMTMSSGSLVVKVQV